MFSVYPELTYRAIRVPVEEFLEAITHLKQLEYRGLNVTLPLKEVALQNCTPTDEASNIGAVNTLFLDSDLGDNTDWLGIQGAMLELGLTHPGRALVLGAGGTARAVLYALYRAEWRVSLWNRTKSRAEALIEDCLGDIALLDEPDPSSADLVINTTSAMHQGELPPLRWDGLGIEQVVMDASYSAEETPFVLRARECGARATDGRLMLVHQGAASYRLWTGDEPDIAGMKRMVGL